MSGLVTIAPDGELALDGIVVGLGDLRDRFQAEARTPKPTRHLDMHVGALCRDLAAREDMVIEVTELCRFYHVRLNVLPNAHPFDRWAGPMRGTV